MNTSQQINFTKTEFKTSNKAIRAKHFVLALALENGFTLQIPKQSLLIKQSRQESTKTTEIYLHISNKSLAKPNGPLDYIIKHKQKGNNNLHKLRIIRC